MALFQGHLPVSSLPALIVLVLAVSGASADSPIEVSGGEGSGTLKIETAFDPSELPSGISFRLANTRLPGGAPLLPGEGVELSPGGYNLVMVQRGGAEGFVRSEIWVTVKPGKTTVVRIPRLEMRMADMGHYVGPDVYVRVSRNFRSQTRFLRIPRGGEKPSGETVFYYGLPGDWVRLDTVSDASAIYSVDAIPARNVDLSAGPESGPPVVDMSLGPKSFGTAVVDLSELQPAPKGEQAVASTVEFDGTPLQPGGTYKFRVLASPTQKEAARITAEVDWRANAKAKGEWIAEGSRYDGKSGTLALTDLGETFAFLSLNGLTAAGEVAGPRISIESEGIEAGKNGPPLRRWLDGVAAPILPGQEVTWKVGSLRITPNATEVVGVTLRGQVFGASGIELRAFQGGHRAVHVPVGISGFGETQVNVSFLTKYPDGVVRVSDSQIVTLGESEPKVRGNNLWKRFLDSLRPSGDVTCESTFAGE